MQKRIQWVAMMALLLASPALYALGLGSAKVNSYLNQPLDVQVELISQNSEELQSVTVGLASARDFELLGLELNSITIPLEFEIVTQGSQSFIHITSNLNAGDPVMQVLVEVVWANGRMLREYTLFLDPPTLGSKAPAPQVSNKPAAVAAPPAPVPAEPPQVATVQSPPQQITPVVQAAPESIPAASDNVDADDEPPIRNEQDSARVGKGQTLWGIASDWSKGSGYSVNQTMLAIQRKNPDAFINDNINLLKQGEILRMPASNEMAEITAQQAVFEVQRQASDFSPGLSTPDYDTPTVADSGDYQESFQDDVPAADDEYSDGRLEIVPPSDALDDAVGAISQASDEETAADADGLVLQEKLTRTEEDLINAELENNYLKERIAELESDAEAVESLEIQDADLANMEAAMADQQASDEPAPPVALTPGGEQQPWYAGVTIWLLAAALFLILLIVWFLRRRNRADSASLQEMEDRSTVQAVTDDAEDLLDILDNYDAGASARASTADADEEPLEFEDGGEAEVEPGVEVELERGEKPETVETPVLTSVPDNDDLDYSDLNLSDESEVHVPDDSMDASDEVIESDAESAVETVSAEDSSDEDSNDSSSSEASDPELKLDLARAYLSLGDTEAAKSMLDEVLLNGNDEQIAEAKQMLDEL